MINFTFLQTFLYCFCQWFASYINWYYSTHLCINKWIYHFKDFLSRPPLVFDKCKIFRLYIWYRYIILWYLNYLIVSHKFLNICTYIYSWGSKLIAFCPNLHRFSGKFHHLNFRLFKFVIYGNFSFCYNFQFLCL